MDVKISIIGSGPAAWTAALYAARAELQPLIYTGVKKGGLRGGQLMTTFEVENYPAFPLGVIGPELVRLMEEQARRFGIRVFEEDVIDLDIASYPFIVRGTSNSVRANSLILATGAYAKRLDLPGEKDFWGKGISACAICDGALPLFRNQTLAVIGGGDSACEEALFLTKYAKQIYLIHRRDTFRASKIMQDRIMKHPKIKIFYHCTVEKASGSSTLESIEIKDGKTEQSQTLSVKGLFYAVGHLPNTEIVQGKMDLDDVGYVKVKAGSSHTSIEGVFAAGDVADRKYRQAITAAGFGCMAALDAGRWLLENNYL